MGIKSCRKQWIAILCTVIVTCVNFGGIVPLAGAHGEALDADTYSETFIIPTTDTTEAPLPEECATPAPSADLSASDSTDVPAPAASEPVTAVALSVVSLYLKSDLMICAEQTASMELVLIANNASGSPLQPFGIRFDLPDDIALKVNSINMADSVRFNSRTLWVEGAIVQDGRVTVAGENLRLTLNFQPFPAGSELTSACVSIMLLDESGDEVNLKECERDDALVDLNFTYQRNEPVEPAVESNKAETTPEPAASAPDQQPLESNLQSTAALNDTMLRLTSELDEPAVTEPGDFVAYHGLPEETVQAESPASTPEPVLPSVQRQLRLVANIPYSDLKIGDVLILTAVITGYDGLKIHIQWQQRTQDEWLNIEGANSDTLTLLMTTDNFHSAWRYDVTVEQ